MYGQRRGWELAATAIGVRNDVTSDVTSDVEAFIDRTVTLPTDLPITTTLRVESGA